MPKPGNQTKRKQFVVFWGFPKPRGGLGAQPRAVGWGLSGSPGDLVGPLGDSFGIFGTVPGADCVDLGASDTSFCSILVSLEASWVKKMHKLCVYIIEMLQGRSTFVLKWNYIDKLFWLKKVF